jgi:hypothetical protein
MQRVRQGIDPKHQRGLENEIFSWICLHLRHVILCLAARRWSTGAGGPGPAMERSARDAAGCSAATFAGIYSRPIEDLHVA